MSNWPILLTAIGSIVTGFWRWGRTICRVLATIPVNGILREENIELKRVLADRTAIINQLLSERASAGSSSASPSAGDSSTLPKKRRRSSKNPKSPHVP
jgi:hypothetical protein